MHCELITPEKIHFSGAIAEVIIPGSEGQFGVLPGHENMIATMIPGDVEFYVKKDDKSELFLTLRVSKGFVEVTPGHCIILADEIIENKEVTENIHS